MSVVGYIRVSTDEQGRSGLGLEAQGDAIRKARPAAEIRSEVASGKSLDRRPVLDGILRGMRRGDVLVVAKLDRLSRSLADFAALVERATSGGWAIVALDVGVDTSTAAGEMMVNVMATFARYERRLISERTRVATLARLRRDDDEWADIEDRIRDLTGDGLSQRAIASQLRIHRSRVVRAQRRSA